MRNRICLLLLCSILIASACAKIDLDFKCKGTDATLTSYSYLRESPLEENGYTLGLKTGSFNYLEQGKNIDFKEHISYKYGNATNKTNSTVTHDMTIVFDGGRDGRGISKFYGTGFFKNNRAISAFKEIRYEDLRKYENIYPNLGSPFKSKLRTTLGKTHNASKFTVNANLGMDLTPGIGYNLKYKAYVEDAVVETRDRSGWTNRTGARRIDLEHLTLMRGGKLTIYNNLSDSAPFTTGPGSEGDWLPCCFASTKPLIEGLDTNWPSNGVLFTLAPPKILPSCSDKCKELCKSSKCKDIKDPVECGKCSRECLDSCTWKCEENNCSGYECINTYNDEPTAASREAALFAINRTAKIFANAFYKVGERKNNQMFGEAEITNIVEVTYKLSIKNTGEIKLYDIVINDTLPGGLRYINSSYSDKPNVELNPDQVENDDATTKRLQWKLGSLDTGEEKIIILTLWQRATERSIKYKENTIEVSAPLESEQPVRYIRNEAQKEQPKTR